MKYKVIVGLDESGRGSLAGPVVAAAVFLKRGFKIKIRNLRDSKKLSPKKREEIFEIIKKNSKIKWATGKVSQNLIDKINILEATKLAMERALRKLNLKLQSEKLKKKINKNLIDFLILDGNFKLNLKISQKSVIKGDEKILSCLLAGIIAKVTRDKIMKNYSKKFPQYEFETHKGYPTRDHLKKIKIFGPCEIHRKSFLPVKRLQKNLKVLE